MCVLSFLICFLENGSSRQIKLEKYIDAALQPFQMFG